MKRIGYTRIFTSEDLLDVVLYMCKNTIMKFALNYRALIDGKWEQIYRVDNYHGFLHEQKFWRTAEPIPIINIENLPLIYVVERYADEIHNNYYKFRRCFVEAKERQSFIQGKIQELKNNLATSIIIDPKDLTDDRAVFWSTVTIEDVNTEEIVKYQLVGPFESDVNENKISVTSPIGKALIGKEVGDEVKVNTPGGVREFEIVDISILP